MHVGRYETLCTIASGGMATVHLARAVGLGGFERLVAIKLMHAHLADDPEFVAMFLDEARLAARIRHPNVVATIDVQPSDEGPFLVMEYVEGPSLRNILRKLHGDGRLLPMDIATRVFVDMLSGLHAAHELRGAGGDSLKLVHRDVSPANVLVGTDGVVRLTDFGVARAESRLSSTRGGQLKGKIPYMAPEQLLGEPMDRRADVYSAGAVLWEVLTGRRLFVADSDGQLVNRILNEDVPTPRSICADVPEPIERACMRALARQVEGRYVSAADFSADLEDAAAEADVRIATARTVAKCVEDLGVHRGTDDLTADVEPPPESVRSGASSGSGTAEELVARVRLASSHDLAAESGTPPSSSAASRESHGGHTATAATISAAHIPPRRAKDRRLLVAVPLTLAVGGLAAVLLFGGEPPSGTPDETAAAAGQGAESAAATASAEPAAASSAEATSTASEVEVIPSATVSAVATAAPKATAPQSPRAIRPSKPAPTGKGQGAPATKPTSAAGYRPSKL